MSDTSTTTNAPAPADRAPLDEVMIAMDVVDTLRHDERIAEQELSDDARRADLIKRLREIYKGQGIEVSDRILEEGVKALEQDRFVYKPPKPGWKRKLAEIYVTRGDWGQWVIGALAGIALVAASWYLIYERPRAKKIETARIELGETLPRNLTSLAKSIAVEAKEQGLADGAALLRDDGLAAAKAGDAAKAREAAARLRNMLADLRQEFQVKIVQRRGQLSGLWRIPKVNPSARNYYLIVEAVRADGKVVPRTLLNEETGKRETVSTWAIRVPKAVLDQVQADKSDDGIIQNAVIGAKPRGVLEPRWQVNVSGGTLTRW